MKKVLRVVIFLALACLPLSALGADFNGDGYDDIAIFRASSGLWAVRDVTRAYFGASGDIPVPGMYSTTNQDQIAIYRPSTGMWAVKGGARNYFGLNDEPVTGGGGKSFWQHSIATGDLYYFDGNIGIGVANPSAPLMISEDSTVSYPQMMLYEQGSNDYARLTFRLAASSDFFTIAGMPKDITADARMHIYYNETGNIMTFTGDGKVGIGTANPAVALEVNTDQATNYAARFINDGNNTNRYGIRVQCGTDDASGNNVLVGFADGDGTFQGAIRLNGGTIVYDTFTAQHNAALPEKDNGMGYPYGTVVSLRLSSPDPSRPHQPIYKVEPSEKICDNAVFGVYAGKLTLGENLHSIYAIGDGHILVTNEGGDIGLGDYLTTSSMKGHAMKQDDDLRHSYTVAKALEPVEWAKEKAVSKLFSCTYQTQ